MKKLEKRESASVNYQTVPPQVRGIPDDHVVEFMGPMQDLPCFALIHRQRDDQGGQSLKVKIGQTNQQLFDVRVRAVELSNNNRCVQTSVCNFTYPIAMIKIKII